MPRLPVPSSPLGRAGAGGVVAYLLGYLVSYLWTGQEATAIVSRATVVFTSNRAGTVAQSSLGSVLGDAGVSTATAVGWLFYNAHLVPVQAGSFPVAATSVSNVVLGVDAASTGLLLVVPPVALVAAGFLVGRSAPDRATPLPVLRARVPAGTVRGAALAAGYLPPVVVGSVLLGVAPPDARVATLTPDLLLGTLVAGLLYPVVFGGVGGWLAGRVAETTEPALAAGE